MVALVSAHQRPFNRPPAPADGCSLSGLSVSDCLSSQVVSRHSVGLPQSSSSAPSPSELGSIAIATGCHGQRDTASTSQHPPPPRSCCERQAGRGERRRGACRTAETRGEERRFPLPATGIKPKKQNKDISIQSDACILLSASRSATRGWQQLVHAGKCLFSAGGDPDAKPAAAKQECADITCCRCRVSPTSCQSHST